MPISVQHSNVTALFHAMIYLLLPGEGCEVLRSTCLYMSVCLRNYVFTLHVIFLYMLPVTVARSSSDDNAICYVRTGFVDDVTFFT